MRGKEYQSSGVNEMIRTRIEGCSITYWNNIEDEVSVYGVDQRKYVFAGDLLRRRPVLTTQVKN